MAVSNSDIRWATVVLLLMVLAIVTPLSVAAEFQQTVYTAREFRKAVGNDTISKIVLARDIHLRAHNGWGDEGPIMRSTSVVIEGLNDDVVLDLAGRTCYLGNESNVTWTKSYHRLVLTGLRFGDPECVGKFNFVLNQTRVLAWGIDGQTLPLILKDALKETSDGQPFWVKALGDFKPITKDECKIRNKGSACREGQYFYVEHTKMPFKGERNAILQIVKSVTGLVDVQRTNVSNSDEFFKALKEPAGDHTLISIPHQLHLKESDYQRHCKDLTVPHDITIEGPWAFVPNGLIDFNFGGRCAKIPEGVTVRFSNLILNGTVFVKHTNVLGPQSPQEFWEMVVPFFAANEGGAIEMENVVWNGRTSGDSIEKGDQCIVANMAKQLKETVWRGGDQLVLEDRVNSVEIQDAFYCYTDLSSLHGLEKRDMRTVWNAFDMCCEIMNCPSKVIMVTHASNASYIKYNSPRERKCSLWDVVLSFTPGTVAHIARPEVLVPVEKVIDEGLPRDCNGLNGLFRIGCPFNALDAIVVVALGTIGLSCIVAFVFARHVRSRKRYLKALPQIQTPEEAETSTCISLLCLPRSPLNLDMSVELSDTPLGGGGMTSVTEGHWRAHNQRVAVKRAMPGVDTLDNELFIYSRIPVHINILLCLGAHWKVESVQDQYLVLEFMDHDLHQIIHNNPDISNRTYLQLVGIFRFIAEGLQHLHAHGVAHLDVKPSNILLNTRGCVKVADFGMSKVMDTDKRIRNTHGGTSSYKAPEYEYSINPLGEKVDVYALGVTMWEAVSGQLPPDRINDGSLQQQVTQLGTSVGNEPGNGNFGEHWLDAFPLPECPAPLRDLIHQCLAFEDYMRPSIGHVVESLRGFLEEGSGEAEWMGRTLQGSA